MPTDSSFFMQAALDLAKKGQGFVEPNPMVGCVLVRDGEIVGQGYHESFGGPHAEINALRSCEQPSGSTAYVTLEPCCHDGKTGPCTKALIDAGIGKVIIGMKDPFSQVNGGGIRELENAGIDVAFGCNEAEACELNRPYLKRVRTGQPWIIAKWAMTLDGRIATSTGSSQWISNEKSRSVVHDIRGRMDAIMIGIGTALADDPLLTARPAGPRTPLRVVVDSAARLPTQSQLVGTAKQDPVIVCVGPNANAVKCKRLEELGCQVIRFDGESYEQRNLQILKKLFEMNCTNVLVEGGSQLLGTLNDAHMVNEFHCFIAPKIVGGDNSFAPIAGNGVKQMCEARELERVHIQQLGSDIYISART